ncbi:hypothetical protein ACFOET_11275 [Parapedobacter deserti]|uniref:Uncharacterized protein n=1 Tax=Parapedobacter deserti TaxID=1912957 RepID=A0ABV7JSD7_9SPHI
MEKLTVEIASPPDRDDLVAELWLDGKMVAEINQESNELEIEYTLKIDLKSLIKTSLMV